MGSKQMMPQFIEALSLGQVRVLFRKRTNNLMRSLLCTLNRETIPPEHLGTLGVVSESIEGDRYIVWDVESNDWRSFYQDSIIAFEPETPDQRATGEAST